MYIFFFFFFFSGSLWHTGRAGGCTQHTNFARGFEPRPPSLRGSRNPSTYFLASPSFVPGGGSVRNQTHPGRPPEELQPGASTFLDYYPAGQNSSRNKWIPKQWPSWELNPDACGAACVMLTFRKASALTPLAR